MLCFLPPVPAIRPEPLPDRSPPRPVRAAEAVILIFVVLNVLFVVTGLLPLVVRMESRTASQPSVHPACDFGATTSCRPQRPPARVDVRDRP